MLNIDTKEFWTEQTQIRPKFEYVFRWLFYFLRTRQRLTTNPTITKMFNDNELGKTITLFNSKALDSIHMYNIYFFILMYLQVVGFPISIWAFDHNLFQNFYCYSLIFFVIRLVLLTNQFVFLHFLAWYCCNFCDIFCCCCCFLLTLKRKREQVHFLL